MEAFEVSNVKNEKDVKVLEDGLAEHIEKVGAPPLILTPLSILKRNSQGAIVAGLYGQMFWNWLYIDSLWVSPAHRKQGLGRSLMAAAEKEAQKQGCVGVHLTTQSFDAPGFYPKIGYTEFARIDGFPVDHERHYFMKRIAA